MFEDILKSNDEYKMEKYLGAGKWAKCRIWDIQKSDVFRYLEMPQQLYQAAKDAEIVEGKWKVMGSAVTGEKLFLDN